MSSTMRIPRTALPAAAHAAAGITPASGPALPVGRKHPVSPLSRVGIPLPTPAREETHPAE
ncbi:hypothetical protein [Naasia sp. SYSU D00948]|uniref:hypothetical protein n=1 Tax=Naasia sp. SYSU D00948 TaxID=2817379 RepID=UPI001B3106D6|nr:hypothetical protein [Naasia sp. SYSU D00948]